MDARQCCPESTLSELHECDGLLPPSVCPEASKQHRCSANYNVQQNIKIDENR